MQNIVETIIDCLFIVGMVAFVGMTLISSLLISRRSEAQQTRIVGKSSWLLSASFWLNLLFSLLFLAIAFALSYFLWKPFVSVSPALSLTLRVIGLIVFLGGLGFAVWARWMLGTNWARTTTAGVLLQVDHQLIQKGPFALVRHPMYLGGSMTVVGALIAYHTWTVLILLLLCASLIRRARLEETALSEIFGDQWRAYASRVPKFFPRLR